MTPDQKRRRLHAQVLEQVAAGVPRNEAHYIVADAWGLRAGHVAAAYFVTEREIRNAERAAREPQQLELGVEA